MNQLGAPVNIEIRMRTTKSRPYRMQRRAESVNRTRLRITEAAVQQHTTVGPASTSIASIAEAAGVTRLTVYRHFADLDELFEACRGHWIAENPPPDVTRWLRIEDLTERARLALGDLYGWFRAHHEELSPIYRDIAAMPASVQEAMRGEDTSLAEALVRRHAGRGPAGKALRAAAGHLVDFRTWHSLAMGQGLTDGEAVDLAVALLGALGSAQAPRPRSRSGGPSA